MVSCPERHRHFDRCPRHRDCHKALLSGGRTSIGLDWCWFMTRPKWWMVTIPYYTYGPMVGWGHKPNKWWGPCRVWTPNVHDFNIAPPYYRGREESACEAHVDQWKQHYYMILSQTQGLNSCVLFCCMYEWLYCKCLCTYVMSCHAIQSIAMYSRCITINLLYTFIYRYMHHRHA